MLAHRSAGATAFFLLCSAGFTLSHPARTARCKWHFCLYCMRFVRRHEMNQHSASLLSLAKDFHLSRPHLWRRSRRSAGGAYSLPFLRARFSRKRRAALLFPMAGDSQIAGFTLFAAIPFRIIPRLPTYGENCIFNHPFFMQTLPRQAPYYATVSNNAHRSKEPPRSAPKSAAPYTAAAESHALAHLVRGQSVRPPPLADE